MQWKVIPTETDDPLQLVVGTQLLTLPAASLDGDALTNLTDRQR